MARQECANNNGKVGLYGISYPGFYTSAGMVNAIGSQGRVAAGADRRLVLRRFLPSRRLLLSHAFRSSTASAIRAAPEPTTNRVKSPNYGTQDGYRFFLDIGPLKNVNPRHYKDKITFWNEMMDHPTYDKFWQDRNLLPHLKKVAPAVMTVGGWFDAEDLYGTFRTYQAIEKQNPRHLQRHGRRPLGARRVVVGRFDVAGAHQFRREHLGVLPEGNRAAVLQPLPQGQRRARLARGVCLRDRRQPVRKFDHWPPKEIHQSAIFLRERGLLSTEGPKDKDAVDSFVSDPKKPVPTSERIVFGMPQAYMTDDMRYASARPDVLTYQSDVLPKDLTFAGPIQAELYVSTSGTDSDWVVKVIDVFPNDSRQERPKANRQGHARLSDARAQRDHPRRYRNSFSKPEPFKPDEPVKISLTLQDVLHTFKKGHRVMVQVHSTWFPLADRNPQKYVPNIFFANDDDFIVATQKVYRTPDRPSQIRVGVLGKE